MADTQKDVVEALKLAALDLHEAAGRFATISSLDPAVASELTREAGRRADEALAAISEPPVMIEREDGWCDWIHPLPGYQMTCCDCGLVHEMQFEITENTEDNAAFNPGESDGGIVIFRARRLIASLTTTEPTGLAGEDLQLLEKHGVLSERLAARLPTEARDGWYHLTSMFSHRGDDIPTQHTYPQEARNAAAALVKAALRTGDRDEVLEYLESEARRFADFYSQGSDGRNTFTIFADKIAALKGASS